MPESEPVVRGPAGYPGPNYPTGQFPAGPFASGAFPGGPSSPAQEEASEVNLRDYLRILVKHVWVIAVFFAVVLAGVAIHTFRQPWVYRASSRVNIRREVPELSQLQSLWNFYSTQQEYMETQYKIIASKKVARKAYQKLRLGDERTSDEAIDGFLKGIVVTPVKDTFLVDVSYEGTDPDRITQYVNTIVQVYIDMHTLEKASKSIEAENAIQKELPKIVEQRRQAENQVRAFQEQYNLLSFDESKARLNRNLDAIEQDLQQLQREFVDGEARKASIEAARAGKGLFSLSFVQDSRVVSDLKLQVSRLTEQFVETQSLWKAGSGFPELEILRQKIDEKNAELQREVDLLVDGTLRRFIEIGEKIKEQLRRKSEITEALNDLERKKFEWDRLQAEVVQRQKIHEEAAAKLKEISYATGVSLSEITVVDPAEVPKAPVRPKPALNLTMAAVIGLLGGIGLAFFFEYLDDTIKGPEDVERYLRTPLLGIIPTFARSENESKRDLQAFNEPKSTISETFRSIRTGILFSSPDREPASLLIWSAGSGEGKTMVSINLAIAMAQAGSRVVIVDGDLRRPRVHTAFSVEGEDGLSSYLSGQKDIEALLVKTQVENLTLVPAGPTPPNPSELLGAERMRNLVKILLERFDKVVIDSPPAMIVTDALLLASIVDGLIQVVSASNVSRKVLARSLEQMSKMGGRTIGAVLNKVRSKKGSYDYYSGYYYYGYYGHRK
jgi:succinoglycan biosynthesis transport protein ExoP